MWKTELNAGSHDMTNQTAPTARFTPGRAWILLASLLLLPGLSLQAQPVEIDKVIAVVDDDVVLKSEFEERWGQVQEQISKVTGPLPPVDVLRKQVLDQLIIEHLQMQMARRAGIRVDDNQLNQAMASIAQENNLSFEQFVQVLQTQGLYDLTRDALRNEIIRGQFQNGAVNRRIDITRQEIENFLRSEAGISETAPEFHVAHVLIPAPDSGPTPVQTQLADLLYNELEKGADIGQVAAAGQISGIAVSGGDLGWQKAEGLPSIFAAVVPTLQPGQISKPFTSSSGYHIVQLLETRGGAALQIEQYQVRHILIKPNEVRTDAQAETLIRDLYARINNGEDFADIARQHTDDPTSMVSGGNLDWISNGMLPDDFMQVVRNTEPDTMTEPFRVSTGWHVVEVTGKRMQDVTEDNKRYQAEQILRQRKFENELENWLTEIRDTSYIDIRDF